VPSLNRGSIHHDSAYTVYLASLYAFGTSRDDPPVLNHHTLLVNRQHVLLPSLGAEFNPPPPSRL